jgi:hypothetical protein
MCSATALTDCSVMRIDKKSYGGTGPQLAFGSMRHPAQGCRLTTYFFIFALISANC